MKWEVRGARSHGRAATRDLHGKSDMENEATIKFVRQRKEERD